jgi:hypothetical protein
VALGWEKFNPENNEERLTFKFGETLESVTKKIKERGHHLLNEEIKIKTI